MHALEIAIVLVYLGTLTILALYGCHRYYLLYLCARGGRSAARATRRLDPLPVITVQLPVYNEIYVVERVIRAACNLAYPADLLEIQVLDDSDDETSRIAAAMVSRMRRLGHDIVHLRRGGRDGYKAGALAHGLRLARGEFIAVFDADFLPEPGLLRELIHQFHNPRVGMVQARWGHLNRDYSLLTRLQSIFLDGHFIIEHAARHAAGRFFNFNGTAGIWRRSCIESAGGWEGDTLTEDLDLSYRAQLKGWAFVFLPDVVVPAEVPADLEAYRSQQRRWARGSIETARKILPRLLRARLPLGVKIEAIVHLTANGAYALMVVLALLVVPAMAIRRGAGPGVLLLVDLPLFLLSTLSVSAFYASAERRLGRRPAATLHLLPLLMALGVGLSLNNARAVLDALFGGRSTFVRTPKHDLRGTRGEWRGKRYRGTGPAAWTVLDMLLACYFAGATAIAILQRQYASLPFLLLFLAGFLSVSMLSLLIFAGRGRASRHVQSTLSKSAKKRLDAELSAS